MAAIQDTVVLPGDLLANKVGTIPGLGTHAISDTPAVFASLAGRTSITKSTNTKPAGSLVSVLQSSTQSSPLSSTLSFSAATPAVGDIIFGRVTRTTPRQATLDILATGMTGAAVLEEPFQALIRQQDIQATEIDKVKVSESFRVGDVVRAVVISLGDERNYYVSTARNEFGVVLAESAEGRNQMVPISWKEMKDLTLGIVELRKVAKVV